MAQTEIESRAPRGRAELIAALADSRSGLKRDTSDLADLANVPKRIRATVSEAPLARAAAALAAGFISSKWFSKKGSHSSDSSRGWFRRTFPEFDLKKLMALLLKSYLEPDLVDLGALLRNRLREHLRD